MSAAGGDCTVTDITIKLNDEARRGLPDEKCLASKSYKPKNYPSPSDDDFPDPPSGPYATKLSVFDGVNPNGTWNLYVVDHGFGDSGQIMRGWSLRINIRST
jgi:hypothetical protein